MSSEAISTLRLSRWTMRRASFAVVVVLPEPCRPTIMIGTGGTELMSMVWLSAPSVSISSSWTILTTIWPGVTDLTTVAPIACSRTRSVKLRTTSSATSASSSARRTSRIAASTSFSVSAPRPVRRSRMPPSRSDRLSNNAVVPCPALRRVAVFTVVMPRLDRGIQYAAARRFKPSCLWNTGSPAFKSGDDHFRSKRSSKHLYARGRTALSGVGLWPPGPVGGSKRKPFRESGRVKRRCRPKVKES